MAASSAGIYCKLRDKSTSIEEKMKLVCFAWTSRQIVLPNKEQMLVNYLATVLLNKRKYHLTEEDVGRVWRCLSDILHSRKAQTLNKQNKAIFIKQSLSQVIVDAVTMATAEGRPYLRDVLRCCEAILMSSTFRNVFTVRLEHLVSLSGRFCQILVTDSSEGELRLLTENLLLKVLKKLLLHGKSASNQHQLFQSVCDKLLLPTVRLLLEQVDTAAAELHHVYHNQQSLKILLEDVLQNIFFHKEQLPNYSSYLSIKAGETTTKSQPPKLMDSLFTVIAEALHCKVSQSECDVTLQRAMIEYLPTFLNGFISSSLNDEYTAPATNMLMHLCSLIGVKSDSAAPCNLVAEPLMLQGTRQLLTVFLQYDLYSVVTDDLLKDKLLKYFRHVTEVLLNSHCLCADWYGCLEVLLQIDHRIIEPRLADIIKHGWFHMQGEKDLERGLEGLLQRLVTTYSKLRHIPRFMNKILDTVAACSSTVDILLPSQFIIRFGEMVQSLPQGSMVDMWSRFTLELTMYVQQNSTHTGKLLAVSTLFYHYLLNVRVTDSSITDLTYQKVQELMGIMAEDVLQPLLQIGQTQETPVLISYLQLQHVWAELVLMMSTYRHCASLDQKYSSLVTASSHLYRVGQNSSSPVLQFLLDVHTVQVIHAHASGRIVPIELSLASLASVLQELAHSLTTHRHNAGIAWDGQASSINEENLTVGKWHLLTSNISALTTVLTEDHMAKMADIITRTCPKIFGESSEITMESCTEKLLCSPASQNNSVLQSAILTAVCSRLQHAFTPASKSLKKSSRRSLHKLTEMLSVWSNKVNWSAGQNSTFLHDCESLVCSVLRETSDIGNYQIVDESLEVLSALPLSQLGNVEQLRCFLLLLAVFSGMVCTTDVRTINSADISTVHTPHVRAPDSADVNGYHIGTMLATVIDLLLVLLECAISSSFFHVVPIPEFIRLLQKCLRNLHKGDNYSLTKKLFLLAEVSCHSMCRDFDILPKLQRVVNELQDSVRKYIHVKQRAREPRDAEICCVMTKCLLHQINQLLNKPYLKEDVKDLCKSLFISLVTPVCEMTPMTISSVDISIEVKANHLICVAIAMSQIGRGDHAANITDCLEDSFSDIHDNCLEIISSHKCTSQDIYHQMAALDVLSASVKLKNSSTFTAEQKLKTWTTLCSVILVLSNCHMPTGDQFSDKKSTDLGNDLDQSLPKWKLDCASCVDRLRMVLNNSELTAEVTSPILHLKERGLTAHVTPPTSHLEEKIWTTGQRNALYRQLVFEGSLEDQKQELLHMCLCSVMADVVTSLHPDQFQEILRQLLQNMDGDNVVFEPQRILAALSVWRQILQCDLSHDLAAILINSAHKVVLSLQDILRQVSYGSITSGLMSTVGLSVLSTQHHMLQFGPSFLSPQTSVLCLQSCLLLPLKGAASIPGFQAVYKVLNAFLVCHSETATQNLPAVRSVVKKLLQYIIEASSQSDQLEKRTCEEKLVSCAFLIERLCMFMSDYKVEFGVLAVYVVADYVTEVQKVTLLPAVKKVLIAAMYKMLDLCDKHGIQMLLTVLPPGVKDIFKSIYTDYTKYGKYTGKV